MTSADVFVLTLGLLSSLAAVRSLLAAMRYVQYARRASGSAGSTPDEDCPGVTLVVPCCGDEDGLEANLEAFLGQAYPRFHVRFVVANAEDGAVPIIDQLRRRHPGRAGLVLAGHVHGMSTARTRTAQALELRGVVVCSQKVHNLLAALDAGPLGDVLVFADSDGRPEPGWLRRLVAALRDPRVGVASSYRFYRPVPATFATLLRSVWNLSVLALLGDHERNFAWGGSMAIRREVFDQAKVRDAWRGALSDDYAITHAARRAGLHVAFVPGCLVGSEGRVGLASMLSWVARQISITRVYWRLLFWLAAASSLGSTAFLVLAPVVGGVVPLSLLAVVLALGAASGGLRAVALGHLAPQWRAEVHRWLWAYVLMAPLSGLVTSYAVVSALRSRRIEWRGFRYEMRSPNETVILERPRSI